MTCSRISNFAFVWCVESMREKSQEDGLEVSSSRNITL